MFTEDALEKEYKKAWIDTQLWARLHTFKDDIFISPPYLEGFRIHSQRTVIVEAKDGGVGTFDISFALKWWRRMNDLGYNNLKSNILNFAIECKNNYNNLTENKFRQLADKYNANYVVVERPKKLNFNLRYENKYFRIYSLR